MKQLFRKTLLAAAVAGFSTAAIAGDMMITTATYSAQGVATLAAGATVNGPVANYILKAGYSVDALIKIEMTPGALNASTDWPGTLTAAGGVTFAGAVFNLVSPGTDSALYQVQSVTAATDGLGGSTIGATLVIESIVPATGLPLNASAVAAADVEIWATSTLSNGFTVIDDTSSTGESNSASLTDTADQFGDIVVAADDRLDGVIDVGAERKTFEDGVSTDSLAWTAADNGTGTDPLLSPVVPLDTTVVLNGDFMGMVSGAFSSANGGTAVYNDTAKTVTVTYTGVVTNDTIMVTNSTIVMKEQMFTVDASRELSATVTEELGSANAGSWTLNGAMVNIPYMPYGDGISQIMYVTNTGSQSGDIIVTAFDGDGKSYELGAIGIAAAGTVTKVTGQIQDALAAEDFTSGRVSITITVNAPSDDITVYASYNVSGNRGFVNTDQYKGVETTVVIDNR